MTPEERAWEASGIKSNLQGAPVLEKLTEEILENHDSEEVVRVATELRHKTAVETGTQHDALFAEYLKQDKFDDLDLGDDDGI